MARFIRAVDAGNFCDAIHGNSEPLQNLSSISAGGRTRSENQTQPFASAALVSRKVRRAGPAVNVR
jgi:hypothetical protein